MDNISDYFTNSNSLDVSKIIDEYGKYIFGIIYTNIENKPYLKNDVEDIFNEVLIKLYQYLSRYDKTKGSLKNFILSISKYTTIDYIRKHRNLNKNILNDNLYKDESYELDFIDPNQFLKLINCLDKLDKNIFIRRYYLNQDIQTISIQLNKSQSYIYNRISRGKKKLKFALKGGI